MTREEETIVATATPGGTGALGAGSVYDIRWSTFPLTAAAAYRAAGCDSIVTVTVNSLLPSTGSVTLTACAKPEATSSEVKVTESDAG